MVLHSSLTTYQLSQLGQIISSLLTIKFPILKERQYHVDSRTAQTTWVPIGNWILISYVPSRNFLTFSVSWFPHK